MMYVSTVIFLLCLRENTF